MKFICTVIFILKLSIKISHQHGRLEDPPSRNSAWRFGYNSPINYDDNALNCGGYYVQWELNKGKCGVCGDPYDGERRHEIGGKFYSKKIVKQYNIGEIIGVSVMITSNHLGHMTFKICKQTSRIIEITQACLDENPLQIIGYGHSYPVRMNERFIKIRIKLPDHIRCDHCVIQWHYKAGNNWGSGIDGQAIGFGAQEEFVNCADIAILSSQSYSKIFQITTQNLNKLWIEQANLKKKPTTIAQNFWWWKHTTSYGLSISNRTTITTSQKINFWMHHKNYSSIWYSSKLSFIKTTTKREIQNQQIIKFQCQMLSKDKVQKIDEYTKFKFLGKPICFLLENTNLTCKDCYENCISPYRICPEKDCFCKWYPFNNK